MDRYITVTGNDSNTGTLASPWRTYAGAISRCAAGDTLRFGPGTYAGLWTNKNHWVKPIPGADVAIESPTKYQSIAWEALTDGGIDATDGSITIGKTIAPVITDTKTGYAGLQLTGCRGLAIIGAVADTSADVGFFTTVNPNTGVVTDDILFDRIESRNNGEGMRINGAGTPTKLGGGSSIVIRDAWTHHNGRMVVATPATAGDDFGAVGISLQRCNGVTIDGLRSHDNHSALGASPDYRVDGGAVEIYGATNCTVTGLVASNNEGICETGYRATDCPVPVGNSITDFTVTGPINQGGGSPAFLLRASRGMTIADGLIDVTGPGDIFRWAGDAFGGSWDGSTIRDLVIVAGDGVTVDQTYGKALTGVTFGLRTIWPGPGTRPADVVVNPYQYPQPVYELIAQRRA